VRKSPNVERRDERANRSREPRDETIEESTLARAQLDAALRYRTAYPHEIDARIEPHRQQTAAASSG
jgi:hypothetical protein